MRFKILGAHRFLFAAVLMAAGCASHNVAGDMDEGQLLNEKSARVGDVDKSRDLGGATTLSPALQKLASTAGSSRGVGDSQMPSPAEVGYPVPGTKDRYEVVIHLKAGANEKAIAAAGAYLQLRLGNTLYATVKVEDLEAVSEVEGVERISAMTGGSIPTPPRAVLESGKGQTRDLTNATGEMANFDHQGLTGKGVIVGIVDTGIDWKHADFLDSHGKTRILAVWAIRDDSWAKSNHTIGSAPPKQWNDNTPMGTLYTSDQIDAAIAGTGNVAETDKVGHGTACAGTAAGDNLGVAPDADLVIVNTYIPDSKNTRNDGANGAAGADWIAQFAQQRNEPCVINLSFGGSSTPHDGTGGDEDGFNSIQGQGQTPGVVICASAGNDALETMHARIRYGPNRTGELNNGIGRMATLYVTDDSGGTILNAIFDKEDDWKFCVVGKDKFLFGTDGKPGFLKISKDKSSGANTMNLHYSASDNVSDADWAAAQSYFNGDSPKITAEGVGNTNVLHLYLPKGTYQVSAMGDSENVTHGVMDMYVQDAGSASFGRGGDHQMLIGDPGDADDVITVGSYDFCGQWDNSSGGTTYCDQIDPGNISVFSSGGFRRDGVVKPDIAAPGRYMISAMAAGSQMSQEDVATVTKDGTHLAWAGTSASCPYTVGVVALMLQKNPQLTEDQVKQILRNTADRDFSVTGAVPNETWGYGKLDPAKAIAAVSAAGTATQPQPVLAPAPPMTVAPSPVLIAPTPAVKPPPAAPNPAPIGPAPPPYMPPAPVSMAGTYSGDGIVLQLSLNDDGSYTGTWTKKGTTYSLMAHLVAGVLEGNIISSGTEFAFTATWDGQNLTVIAENKKFTLTR